MKSIIVPDEPLETENEVPVVLYEIKTAPFELSVEPTVKVDDMVTPPLLLIVIREVLFVPKYKYC